MRRTPDRREGILTGETVWLREPHFPLKQKCLVGGRRDEEQTILGNLQSVSFGRTVGCERMGLHFPSRPSCIKLAGQPARSYGVRRGYLQTYEED